MPTAQLSLHPDFSVSKVDPRLFGAFVEHMGRCVYGGIYEPGHPTSNKEGFRRDVLDLVKELDTPIVRYPGGNFVSGYNWQDGVGPKESRPRRLELAWRSIETNQFGTNEFIDWCRAAGTDPMFAVNLGTGTAETARQFIEYCNYPGGSYWSDLRISHGWKEPHKIKTWCLGNEMDGGWQIGHKTAEEYGRIALETAKVMRAVDPSIELVACGSSYPAMPTFPDWDVEVLTHLYGHVDYISLHQYFNNRENNLGKFLAQSRVIDQQIRDVIAVCDLVRARKRGRRDIQLAFDEWNVWYHSTETDNKREPWLEAPPLLEDIYTLEDALVIGCILITLLRHADRVKIACMAQLVNVIGPIFTQTGGGCYRQTIFYPFRDASKYGRGEVLRGELQCDTYEVADIGTVDWLEIVLVLQRENGALTFFAVNRHPAEPLTLRVDVRGFSRCEFIEHVVLDGDDPKARNTFAEPTKVQPHLCTGTTRLDNGFLEIRLPRLSWNVIRFSTSSDSACR